MTNTSSAAPRVSVVMPTYRQARFLPRAVESLRAQTFTDWELIIIDDGSPDDTAAAVAPYLEDARVRHMRHDQNEGLGAALNRGLDGARAEMIAYLPSDDVYFPEHLATLVECLDTAPDAALAYAGVRYHHWQEALDRPPGYPLQLVQALHRRTVDRWTERAALTTDDLDRMFWTRLTERGRAVASGRVTCEWVEHPHQRHKVIREDLHNDINPQLTGGLNPYRARYGVRMPLRFHSSAGNPIDEVSLYRRFRDRPDTPPAPDGLRIVLAGELAFNPERVLALEERGHTLQGLWTPYPGSFNFVGPLPFGHVADLPAEGWRAAMERQPPDLIYALLNWRVVPFAHGIMRERPAGVPFVFHLKEGPWHSLLRGSWDELVDLLTESDGQIYSSPELRDWTHLHLPRTRDGLSMVLDGDLPKREWFDREFSPRLSHADDEPHLLLAGRPMGMDEPLLSGLARNGIHLHVYGEFKGTWAEWMAMAQSALGAYLHRHPVVEQDRWVEEFSRYDAGWLHYFRSDNGGDLRRATWDDLNYPARMATLMAAGLPMLQYDNEGAAVASDALARRLGIGLFFRDADGLSGQLRDRALMERVHANVRRHRDQFTFDAHADDLVDFFRRVIARAAG